MTVKACLGIKRMIVFLYLPKNPNKQSGGYIYIYVGLFKKKEKQTENLIVEKTDKLFQINGGSGYSSL